MGHEDDLKRWTTHYLNADITKRDIIKAVGSYPGLIPKQERYNFNDGNSFNLVNLTGTIPVRYKGTVYNIPIVIWLMNTHPKNAPICYVKPTTDMSIKVSMYVDQNGKIYLPYLHDWADTDSDLLGLIQVMIVTFGDMPPVFAKTKDQGGVMYPHNSFIPEMNPSGYPPYPMGGFPQPGGYSATPYPPYPPTSTTSFPPYHNTPYPTPYPPAAAAAAATPYPPAGPMTPRDTCINAGTIKEEHIRDSLMTAIEEKLMRRMKEQFQQNQAELETLQRTLHELKLGKNRLDEILERLNKEKNDLDKNITVLKDKEQELDKAIERLNNEEAVDVDDAVTTTAPLYKQLLNAFAEEAALEDAIYYMGEALRCGVIDLEVFLRQVRTLSRKQFMLRALMQKCRQKAGLAPV